MPRSCDCRARRRLSSISSPIRAARCRVVWLSSEAVGSLRMYVSCRTGVNELNSGAATLHSGLIQLTDGSFQLSDGAGQLASGMTELQSGSHELADALDQGAQQVPPSWSDQQRTATADTLSTPVALQQNTTNEASTFGTGFAPFFLSLALFVGGIITWMLLTPLQSRPTVAAWGSTARSSPRTGPPCSSVSSRYS